MIVAAIAASTVAANAGVVSFSGTLNQVGTPLTSYSGSYSGNYNTVSGVLSVTGAASAVLVTFGSASNPTAITTGEITAPAGYTKTVSVTAGSVTSTAQSVSIPGVGTYNFFINSQGYGASASGPGASANLLGPVTYTINLKAGTTTVLSSTFTVVPEPEVYAGVAALGLAGFALWRRRNA